MADIDPKFPCSLVIDIPLPSHRLASSAVRTLEVDAELSPLVQRTLSIISRHNDSANGTTANGTEENTEKTVLRTVYRATTNRMLRVAVNGFMESLSVILGVMEELDIDVLST